MVFGDCSLDWLAHEARVSMRTLCRIMADMESVKWLEKDPQQIIGIPQNGIIAVATVVRRITKGLFESMGLLKLLARDTEYIEQDRKKRGIPFIVKTLGKREYLHKDRLEIYLRHLEVEYAEMQKLRIRKYC